MADGPATPKFEQEGGESLKFYPKDCECLINYKRLELKFTQLQGIIEKDKSEDLKKLEVKLDELIGENKAARCEIQRLSSENEKLRERLKASEDEVAKAVGMKVEIEEVKNGWSVNKQEMVDFKKLVEEQKKESENSRSKWMKDAIKSNGRLVRETAEQNRCVVIFGDQEEEEKDRGKRENARAERMVKILNKIVDGDEPWTNQIEEIQKIGSYKKDGKIRPVRPTKIKFRSERVVKEILAKTWKLNGQPGYENVYVRKDLNEEERAHLAVMKKDVADKNDERTEEQKKEFFWRIKDMKVVKWRLRQQD